MKTNSVAVCCYTIIIGITLSNFAMQQKDASTQTHYPPLPKKTSIQTCSCPPLIPVQKKSASTQTEMYPPIDWAKWQSRLHTVQQADADKAERLYQCFFGRIDEYNTDCFNPNKYLIAQTEPPLFLFLAVKLIAIPAHSRRALHSYLFGWLRLKGDILLQKDQSDKDVGEAYIKQFHLIESLIIKRDHLIRISMKKVEELITIDQDCLYNYSPLYLL